MSGKLTDVQKTQLLSINFEAWENMTDTDSLAKIRKIMMEIRFSGNFAVPINSIIGSMASIANKIDIMELQHRDMKSEDVAHIVAGPEAEYAALIERKGRWPKIEKTPENEKLAKVLEATGLISSFAIKGNRIEVHQRKNNRNEFIFILLGNNAKLKNKFWCLTSIFKKISQSETAF